MRKRGIIIYLILTISLAILNISFISYANNAYTEDDRYNTLITLKIIEDSSNKEEPVTRAEFCKIIIRSSEYRDKISDYLSEAVCNDVLIDTPYASYIKKSLEQGYMYMYLGGNFKPNEYVTYNDLSRASLALLSYTNDDFRGNQVIGRNLKFKTLGLNENIKKEADEVLTKTDIVNGIYNTLKENKKDSEEVYGKTIFDKLIINGNKELNASEYIKNDTSGPYFAKNEKEINVPFELNIYNVYLNGKLSNIDEVRDDIVNFGYVIYYIDNDNKILYTYTERQDVSTPVIVRKGYIYKTYYSAANFTLPYRVDIDNYSYYLESEEAKFDFSASGKFNEDDQIVYICNKMNDIDTSYIDSNGKRVYKNEDAEKYDGSIIVAFNIDLIK